MRAPDVVRRAFLLAAAAAALLPARAGAQVVRGRVLADSLPVIGAEVLLRDTAGNQLRAVTDELGLFVFELDGGGRVLVSARHAGYAPAGPQSLDVEPEEEVMLLIRMQAVYTLPPIEVTARRRWALDPSREALENRLAMSEMLGMGRILRREEIERTPVISVRDLLMGTPGVRVSTTLAGQRLYITSGGRDCAPQVYIDGVRDVTGQGILDMLSPRDLEVAEIYRSSIEAPAEYRDPSGCGVIVLWTRRDVAGGRPWSWKRLLALAGVLGVMIWSIR